MPTVLRQDGFRVMIHTDDHAPAHVHCRKSGKAVKIGLDTVTVLKNYGMPANDIRRAIELVEAHQTQLLTEWGKVFPS